MGARNSLLLGASIEELSDEAIEISRPKLKPAPRWTEDSFKMLWVRQFVPGLQRLSLSLMRDLCGYIEGSAVVFTVTQSHLSMRNVITEEIHIVALESELELGEDWVLLALPDWRTFVLCACESKSTYELTLTGGVIPGQDCSSPHHHPGAIFAPLKNHIYLFGGNCADCEKMNVATNEWKCIGEMMFFRSYFHPCLYRDIVYLCGGFHLTIELFDTVRDSFLESPSICLFEISDCLAIGKDNKIVIISQHFRHCWDLQTSDISVYSLSGLSPWSISHTYAVLGRKLYFELPALGVATGDILEGEFVRKEGQKQKK